jgi:hypothetical protein
MSKFRRPIQPLRLLILALGLAPIAATGCAADSTAQQPEVADEALAQNGWTHVCKGTTDAAQFVYQVFIAAQTQRYDFYCTDVCFGYAFSSFAAPGPTQVRVDVYAATGPKRGDRVGSEILRADESQEFYSSAYGNPATAAISFSNGGNIHVELRHDFRDIDSTATWIHLPGEGFSTGFLRSSGHGGDSRILIQHGGKDSQLRCQ